MLKKIVACAAIISIFYSGMGFCMESERDAHSAFIAKQGSTIIQTIGKCDERHSPYSTFKVPLALMAYDSNFFQTPDSPTLSFKEEYEQNFQGWYTRTKGIEYNWFQDHIPKTFMKNSVVWVSHQITKNLGATKFQEYVSKLNYGNMDVSGTPGKDDGLLNSWLGTSLLISPREQLGFLEKLITNAFELGKYAHENTRKIMDREEDWNGWKLYGRTGAGSKEGWFIGWIEKGGRQPIVFAQYLNLDDPDLDLTDIPAQKSFGLTTKEVAKRHLVSFWRESTDQ